MLLFSVGCGSSTDGPSPKTADADHDHDHGEEGHEHHHHAETLPDAITELTGIRNTIRDAFAKNDSEAAHDPLHEVGHVLELIPELAEKQNVSPETLTAIKSSVDTLFTAFGNVDKTLHGQEGSTYAEESETIDKALKALTDAAAGGSAPTPATESPAAPAADAAAPAAETPAAPAADAPAPATEAPATDAPATEAPATETPASETPAPAKEGT